MVVARDGCSKRCLSQGIGSRKEKGSRKELLVARKKVVARNCWSQGIGGRKEGIVVARKELVVARKELVVARKKLVVARNW